MIREQYFYQPSFIPVFQDYDCLRGKHFGITGAEGVLGQIISKRLENEGIRITCYPGDITDTKLLHNWFEKNIFDFFFHFAAIVPVTEVQDDPLKAYDVNAIGTYNICREIIKKQPSCWLFIASSSHVYKNQPAARCILLKESSPKKPNNIYGKTKLLAEQISIPILKQYKISYCIGRIFSFASSIQKEPYLVPTLRRKIKAAPTNSVLNIFNPDCVRDIIDGETVIDCILQLASNYFTGVINIGSGKGMRILDIANHIAKLEHKDIQIKGGNKVTPNSLVANVTLLKKVFSK